MGKPRISIVTPTLNQGKYIEKTIQSVLNQEYENFEYLVIDGGSKDSTLDILRRYEGRLQWWSEKDRGQADAINKGIRRASGEILGYLNSDDFYEPGAFSKVVAYFQENPDVDMVYGEGYLIKEDGTGKRRFPSTEPQFDLWRLTHVWDYILQQSTFFKRDLVQRIGYFNESLHSGLDWDYWIRAGKHGKVGYIPEYLGTLREYDEAKSFSGGFRRVKELYRIVHAHTGELWPPPCIMIYAFDWMETILYRNLSSGFGKRFAGAARFSRKALRGLLGRYIAHTLKRTSPGG
jgi:glycosyltransferase involved in cell wall biosynthesis